MMTDVQLFAGFLAGILLSLALPIAIKYLNEFKKSISAKGAGHMLAHVWSFARPYVFATLASSIIGFFLLVIYRAGVVKDQGVIDSWAKAVFFGYAWDSTIQKITQGLS
jgi:hypothetical protein